MGIMNIDCLTVSSTRRKFKNDVIIRKGRYQASYLTGEKIQTQKLRDQDAVDYYLPWEQSFLEY